VSGVALGGAALVGGPEESKIGELMKGLRKTVIGIGRYRCRFQEFRGRIAAEISSFPGKIPLYRGK
jgi:hypothetical protein